MKNVIYLIIYSMGINNYFLVLLILLNIKIKFISYLENGIKTILYLIKFFILFDRKWF